MWTAKHLLIFFCKEKLMFCGQHMAAVIQKNWFLHMALPQLLLRVLGLSLYWSSVQEPDKFVFVSHWRKLGCPKSKSNTLLCLFPPPLSHHASFCAFSLSVARWFILGQAQISQQHPVPCHSTSRDPDSQQGRGKDNPAGQPKLWCAQHFQRGVGWGSCRVFIVRCVEWNLAWHSGISDVASQLEKQAPHDKSA